MKVARFASVLEIYAFGEPRGRRNEWQLPSLPLADILHIPTNQVSEF